MAGKIFKRTFREVAVEASGVVLRSYSGELSQVQGQAQVSARFGNREATLSLYLTKGSSLTLLGRNWICALSVRLPEGQEPALHVVQDIPSLLTDFQSMFQPGAGLTPLSRKVEAVLKVPKLRKQKELESYLGIINFYMTFLTNLSLHLQPLHILHRDGQHWAWKKDQDLALQHSKELITKAPVLVHFDPAKPVVLTVNTSPYGVGAVLAHRDKDGQERPVSFASRRLHAAEHRYSQLDKEGLTLMFGVERFHQYLRGRKFEAVMDHKPLLGLLGPDKAVPVQASPQVVRWALKLAAYSYQWVYRPGKDLGRADALSRLPLPEVPAAVPETAETFMPVHAYPEILSRSVVSQATSPDTVLSQGLKAVSRGEELVQQSSSRKAAELSLEQGCLLWGSRVVIPKSIRSRVLK
ncbi:hypothetical protein MTO96_028190 [Rhipicephalus appendiculatus]